MDRLPLTFAGGCLVSMLLGGLMTLAALDSRPLIDALANPRLAVPCDSCCPRPVPCRPLDMTPSEPAIDLGQIDMSCAVCRDADGGATGPCTPSRCMRRPDGNYCCVGSFVDTVPYLLHKP